MQRFHFSVFEYLVFLEPYVKEDIFSLRCRIKKSDVDLFLGPLSHWYLQVLSLDHHIFWTLDMQYYQLCWYGQDYALSYALAVCDILCFLLQYEFQDCLYISMKNGIGLH